MRNTAKGSVRAPSASGDPGWDRAVSTPQQPCSSDTAVKQEWKKKDEDALKTVSNEKYSGGRKDQTKPEQEHEGQWNESLLHGVEGA